MNNYKYNKYKIRYINYKNQQSGGAPHINEIRSKVQTNLLNNEQLQKIQYKITMLKNSIQTYDKLIEKREKEASELMKRKSGIITDDDKQIIDQKNAINEENQITYITKRTKLMNELSDNEKIIAEKMPVQKTIIPIMDTDTMQKKEFKEKKNTIENWKYIMHINNLELERIKKMMNESKLKNEEIEKSIQNAKLKNEKNEKSIQNEKLEIEKSIQNAKLELEKSIQNSKLEIEKSIQNAKLKNEENEKSIQNEKLEIEKSIQNAKLELEKSIQNSKLEIEKFKDKLIKYENRKEFNDISITLFEKTIEKFNAAIKTSMDEIKTTMADLKLFEDNVTNADDLYFIDQERKQRPEIPTLLRKKITKVRSAAALLNPEGAISEEATTEEATTEEATTEEATLEKKLMFPATKISPLPIKIKTKLDRKLSSATLLPTSEPSNHNSVSLVTTSEPSSSHNSASLSRQTQNIIDSEETRKETKITQRDNISNYPDYYDTVPLPLPRHEILTTIKLDKGEIIKRSQTSLLPF